MTSPGTPLEHALAYAARGWRIHPIPPGHKHPTQKEWQRNATTDPVRIRRYWGQHPDHGLCIVTGHESGVFALDIDPDDGGDDSLRALEAQHGPLSDTVQSLTGGGGTHYLFRWPDDGREIRNSASGVLGVGIDVRGTGGQIVVAPSVHGSRQCSRCCAGAPCPKLPYRWEVEHDPFDGVAVAEAPEWLLGLLTAPPTDAEPRRERRERPLGDPLPGDWWAAGTTWPDELTRHGWSMHSTHHDAQGGYYELWTRPGKTPREGASASLYWRGSDVLKVFTTNAAPLQAEATYTLWGFHVAMTHGGDFEAAARSVRASMPRDIPREAPPSDAAQLDDAAQPDAEADADADAAQPDDDMVLEVPTSWTDAHVGEVFGRTLAGRWVFCRSRGGWHRWDGRRWRVDEGEAVHERARQWVIALGTHLWAAQGNSEAVKAAARYRSKGAIDSIVTIARRLEGIAVEASTFDRATHLLNVRNGIVDLRTGELLAHDPALMLTKLADTDYEPDAVHRDVAAVLEALSDDARPWVQRLMGCAAFGTVVDDVLAVFDGTGSNGKTTLLKAAASALGEYASVVSTRLLMSKATHEEHPTLIADLVGRRLVYIEETPEGGSLQMERVKQLTGGSAIKARFIGRDQFEFEPSHQLIMATNHRPAVNASDHAAWRRLRLVPFRRTYRLPHEAGPGDLVADRGLRGRLSLPPQRTAMLAWIIAGAVAWHRDGGLGGCDEIDRATAAWRHEEDVIHAWWADSLEIDADSGVMGVHLYTSYTQWCERHGRRASSNKEFAKRLTDHELFQRHSVTRRNTSVGVRYEGISLARVVDMEGTGVDPREETVRESLPPPSISTTTRTNALDADPKNGPETAFPAFDDCELF